MKKLRCCKIENGKEEKLRRKFIDYLGFEFDGSRVRIRGKTLQNAYKKADKRIKKFKLRQTSKNPRKKPTRTNNRKTGNSYIKNANEIMTKFGLGIKSQQANLSRFIKKKKAKKK